MRWFKVAAITVGVVIALLVASKRRSRASKVLAAVWQAAARCGVPAARMGVASKRRSGASAEENPAEPAPSPEAGGTVLGEWAASRGFSTTVLRPGYDIAEVDGFVEAIRQTFLGIRQPPLTPDAVRYKQFSTTRLRPGYDEEEVDAFLDMAELRLAPVAAPAAVQELTKLADMLEKDLLTREEFDLMKAKLLSTPAF